MEHVMYPGAACILEDEINDKSTQKSASVLQPVRLTVFVSDPEDLLPKEMFCRNIATD